MRSLMPSRLNGRTVSAVLVAGALVVSAGVGGATAGAMITGRDIKDNSITAADIKDRTIGTRQLSTTTVDALRTSWNSGVGAPKADEGATNSWYLDTATGDAYKNTPSGWELRVNIMGATGAPGAVGPQGATGAVGATGAQGATGAAGAKGEKGEAGTDGATGGTGATGAQGDKGDTGEAGSKWLRGEGAPAGTIGVLGDWYLDTDSYDAYEKGAQGWAAVVNLRGPVGPKGDTGATGAQGAAGQQGATGSTGQQGPAGSTGGVGPVGPQGAKGDTGAQGAKGDTGAQGAPGAQGAQGPQGLQGLQGLQGPAGGGLTLKDGNDTTLGKVVSMDRSGVSFVTSTGYLFTATWSGVVSPAQVYYSNPCASAAGGQAYLNDGGGSGNPGNRVMLGKFGVFSRTLNTWMVPSTVTQGYATSVSFLAGGFDNPACAETPTPNTRGGWLLRSANAGELGLPASGSTVNQFAVPLSAG